MNAEPRPVEWLHTPVDRSLARKCVNAARRALLSHDREATPREIVFALLSEAADTERAMRRAGPRRPLSSMPEIFHTPSEIFSTEREMIADKISYPVLIRPTVSAAAAGRYLEVTKWLRYVKGRNRKKSKQLLWLLAQGAPAGYVARKTGYFGTSGVRAAKFRRLGDIVHRLKAEGVFEAD